MASRRQLLSAIIAALPTFVVGRAFANSNRLPLMIEKVRPALRDWNLYEICGQSMFPVYGVNGGISCRSISWLIRKRGNQFESIPVEFTMLEHATIDDKGMEKLVNRKIADAIKNYKPVIINLNGGNLPMPEHIEKTA